MKQVIDGKTYNTETAEEIFKYWNNHPAGDLRYCEESLYKTKKGAFFIAGEGGPMTKYARPCGGNNVSSGEGIFVLSPKEALEWCEDLRVDPEIICKHFKVEEA
jgi:hypothetical protein